MDTVIIAIAVFILFNPQVGNRLTVYFDQKKATPIPPSQTARKNYCLQTDDMSHSE
jgi:hypothetical protein